MLPQFESLLSSLWNRLQQQQQQQESGAANQLGNWSLGLVKLAGTKLVRYWKLNNGDFKSVKNLYSLLDAYFGDSLVPYISGQGTGRSAQSKEHGRLSIRRVRMLTHRPVAAPRQEPGDMFGESRNLERGFFSSQENFNFLADMGVPSDIFETGELDPADRNENDFSGYFKQRTVNLSKNAAIVFPEAKPFKFKPRAIKLNLGPCRQMEPDRYSQVGMLDFA